MPLHAGKVSENWNKECDLYIFKDYEVQTQLAYARFAEL
jgi:hypothetical protein